IKLIAGDSDGGTGNVSDRPARGLHPRLVPRVRQSVGRSDLGDRQAVAEPRADQRPVVVFRLAEPEQTALIAVGTVWWFGAAIVCTPAASQRKSSNAGAADSRMPVERARVDDEVAERDELPSGADTAHVGIA